MNHVVDGSSVVFRTAEGTKLDAANGRRVAFEIDGTDGGADGGAGDGSGRAWSVVVKGRRTWSPPGASRWTAPDAPYRGRTRRSR